MKPLHPAATKLPRLPDDIIRTEFRMYTIELFPWDDTPVKVVFRFALCRKAPDALGSRCEWRPEMIDISGAQVDGLELDEHFYRPAGKGVLLSYEQYIYSCLMDIIEQLGGKYGVEEEYSNPNIKGLTYI